MRLTPTPYPPRILIVDDEQDMRDLLIDLIESGGFRAQAVADGTDGAVIPTVAPAEAIFLEAYKYAASGANVTELNRGIRAGADAVL